MLFVSLPGLQTPAEWVAFVGDQVNGILADGSISAGTAHGLQTKLDQVLAHLVAGETTPAANMLSAFIKQIEALGHSARILPEVEDEIIVAARSLMELIGG